MAEKKAWDSGALVAAALAAGHLLRNSDPYMQRKFVAGDKVVSENGARGAVISTIADRPERIQIYCLNCGSPRTIKSQDFYQVVSCSPTCHKALRRRGFVQVSMAHRLSNKLSDLKVLQMALQEGMLTQEQFDEAKRKLQPPEPNNPKVAALEAKLAALGIKVPNS